MKRIHFDEMKKEFRIGILMLSLVLIILGVFEIFEFEDSKLNKRLVILGYMLQILYYSKMFWYKNYVQWNTKGAHIKVNSFIGKSLRFNQIKTTEINDENLIVTKKNDKRIIINLNGIEKLDTQKLYKLILNHSMVSF
ncbi:hypothetical protein FNB79_07935 [Formosa sediminum]|uniref:Uncharacterized protein n=1 Tax=Formosa sediminum TaxID=2594004 RepID=A0A516GQX8_9FLAO|nr:hypothetical protein [Formosa sediminum]QDO93916.1 hypothetical protein FNB79_07935 [Formosa sediminum]